MLTKKRKEHHIKNSEKSLLLTGKLAFEPKKLGAKPPFSKAIKKTTLFSHLKGVN